MTSATFSGIPSDSTRDTEGKTLAQARKGAVLDTTLPAGHVAVLGRYYPLGSMSTTWCWLAMALPAATALNRHDLVGGARFVGVELVKAQASAAPPRVRMPW